MNFVTTQFANNDFNSISGAVRLGLDGWNGNALLIRPYILLGADRYDQGQTTFSGDATLDIFTEEAEFSRFTLGYGAVLDKDFGNTNLRLSASGRRHFNDSASTFNSRFLSTRTQAGLFPTFGRDVDDQYLFDAALSHTFLNSWTVTAAGFGEFGDIVGGGATIRIGKRF